MICSYLPMSLNSHTKQIVQKTQGKQVGLFIDNANWFYPQKELGWRISYHRLLHFLHDHYAVSVARLYTGTPIVPEDTASFERFCQAVEDAGIEVVTKPLKKIWMDRKARTFEYKCNFDVEIALDVAAGLYNDLFDMVMIGSGDSDFLAIRDFAFARHKGFMTLCFEKGVAWEMRKGYHLFLEDLRPLIERA
jgi:uncharacterized LabA/DUF88 family protein